MRNRSRPKPWQKLLEIMHRILDAAEDNVNYGVERMQLAVEQRGVKRSYSTDRKWLTDISQGQYKDGRLYIAPVFDCCYAGEIISLEWIPT